MQTCQAGVGDAVAAQVVLQNRLLLQQVGLGGDQVLLARVQLGLGAGDFDGRRSSELHQPLVIIQKLLGGAHFPQARACVCVEADQIPVKVQRG